MAARGNGIIPIDTVHINIHDLEDLEENLKLAKILGYEGMLILNPKEIDLVHKYFTQSAKEYEDAKEMLALSEAAKSEGKGVAVKNGKFIGPPLVKRAKETILRFERINHSI